MIKTFTVPEFKLATLHFKTGVIYYSVGMYLIRSIWIGYTQGTNNGSYLILVNRFIRQYHGTGSLIYICDSYCNKLFFNKPTTIGGRYLNINHPLFAFVIQTFTILKLKMVIQHFKTIISHRVGMCIIRIWIGHTQYSDGGSCFILFNDAGHQFNGTGSLVDVHNSDCESLFLEKITAIRGSHLDVYCLRFFMVKASVILKFKLTRHHFKTTIIYDVDMCITCIRVGHTQASDDGSHFILFNRAVNQRQSTGSLVDIRNHKGKSLCCGKSTTIRGGYGNLDRLCSLIIKTFAIFELKPTICHLKTSIVYGIDMGVTRIRVEHTQCPDDGFHFILFNRFVSQRQSTGSFVDVCNSKNESLFCVKSTTIRGSYGNLDLCCSLIVKALAIPEFKIAFY